MLNSVSRNSGPIAEPARIWRFAVNVATIGIFLILGTGALIAAANLLVPMAAALILGAALGPAADRCEKVGLPVPVAAFAAIVLLIALLYTAVALAAAPLADWLARLPEIGASLKERLAHMDGPFAAVRDLRRMIDELLDARGGMRVQIAGTDVVPGLIAATVPTLAHGLLFFGTLAFFLAGRRRLRQRFVTLFAGREMRLAVLRILSDVEDNLARYFATVSAINFGLGVATGIGMAAVGLPNPALWGVMAAVVNFVPFVGPALVTIALLLAGLVSFPEIGWALLPAGIFVAIVLVEGQIVVPHVVGRRMTLNPLVVFVGIGFWAWVWGPLGAFLAVPLLIVATAVIDHLFPGDDVSLPG